jgi:hypothetical protein
MMNFEGMRISATVRHVLAVLIAWLVIAPAFAAAADPAPAKIEAREPRVQIRMEILTVTKIGSSPEDVLQFIRTHFQPNEGAPMPKLKSHPAIGPTAKDSAKKGVRSIRLVLGQYLGNPAPFLLEIPLIAKTTTTVQWAFDKDGKLIEVFVDKDSELGDGKNPDD